MAIAPVSFDHPRQSRSTPGLGFAVALVAASAASSLGCHPIGDVAASNLATYDCPATTEALQDTLLAPTCGIAGCHAATAPALSLDLVSRGLEQRISNAPSNGCGAKMLVVPGDPARSYLFEKLEQASPTCGDHMPLALPALSADQIDCLKNWVSSIPLDVGGAGGVGGGDAGPGPDGGAAGAKTDASADSAGCGSGQLSCAGKCTTVATDNVNCGGCGTVCGAGSSCVAGHCACQAGLALCGGGCVDLATSATNCGACGTSCGAGVCASGKCAASCPAGTTNCTGSCVNVLTSSANCGACGKACGAGLSCVSGSCACPAGTTLCGSTCVSTGTDASNCGTCGHACAAGATCTSGVCSCAAGQALCGSACVNTATDPANCGGCGKACPSGASCSAGSCSCAAGQALCGSACVNTATDPANCGACGKACGAGLLCAAGMCGCGPTVSFASQVQPIFTASCSANGCHSGGAKPAAGLSLVAGAAYGALVNVAASSCTGKVRVSPSSVPNSYLMNKLTNAGICNGTQMPKTGQSLSAAELNAISGWICAGAPKN